MLDGIAFFFAISLPPELFQLPEGIGRVELVVAAMMLLLALEQRYGRKSKVDARRSYRLNLSTLLVNDALFSLVSASSLLALADQFSAHGLLDKAASPWQELIAFALLDLCLYFWHRACHAFPWLWCLHQVHHSDPVVNVTTAFRLHFLEVLLTTGIKAGFILITGISAEFVLLAETIIALHVMLQHANLRLPGERWLAKLLATPSLHRMHHSALRFEHDRNFGLMFSLWDRWFGTLREGEPARIGLNGLPPTTLFELFRPKPPSSPMPALCPEIYRMIAEAAYYRAERRGFAPGFELEDWLAAEREILAQALGGGLYCKLMQ
jgi:sterol desaturase/sphingolipid hydroxylase (fatty acid hydroxylase superfamily)